MKKTRVANVGALLVLLAAGSQSFAQDAPADTDAVFKRLDKNGDGKVSASEIPEDQSRFFARLLRRANKDANGELTLDEFRQANKPEERPNVPLGGGPDREQGRANVRQYFDMLDRNKDGKLALDELPEQVRERMKPLFDRNGKQELTFDDFTRFGPPGNGPEPGELFKRFDANADGKLTKDELPPFMREATAPLFERLGKSELTLEEFTQARNRMRDMGNPVQMFARFDANSDGKITASEVPERARPMFQAVLRRAGKGQDDSLTKDEFVKNFPGPGARPGDAGRPDPERKPEGERRPEGDRPGAERRADPAAPQDPVRRDGAPREGRGLAFIRMLDANGDGRISKEELAKAASLFDELDKNHDGQLDTQELIGTPPDRRPDAPDGTRREGQREEGARPEAGRRETRGDAPPAEGRTRDVPANRRDGDGDRASFERIDRDGDGKISRDEAPDPLKERFAMLDTNGDGVVTQDEFRAGTQQSKNSEAPRPQGRSGRSRD